MGAANAGMILQASTMDIYAHPMAGFKPEIIKEHYNLPDNLKPFVVNAFGYLDEPEKLDEPFLTRETTARSRKNLEEIILFQE
jgi:nitroreductase